MARQNTSPVSYQRTIRSEDGVLMSSGRAGVVMPICYMPLLRGDGASGRVSVDFNLAEMPKPLLNAVMCNVQAWFVPKLAHPQFAGPDEFYHSYVGENIEALGAASRPPPSFFFSADTAGTSTFEASDFAKALGIHITAGTAVNADIVDAFNLVYNFRLAAHSSKLERRKYFTEDLAAALAFPRAFWPAGRFSRMVPDYEQALIVGQLDLDVIEGRAMVRGLFGDKQPPVAPYKDMQPYTTSNYVPVGTIETLVRDSAVGIWGDLAGSTVETTLADIDKARTTQSFAKLRSSMAGNDTTGFMNDDVIMAHLMQGLSVPSETFKRPMLLDSKRTPFGFAERFASDGASLDQSVTTGRVTANLNINVPSNDYGGIVIVTAEVLPERIDERQGDPFLTVVTPSSLPDALRDIQRPEPVDTVANARIDAKHTAPTAIYGFEPMNDKWNRAFTRLGGVFYQATPAAPVTESRAGIWQTALVDPVFSEDHWLAPAPFPHTVFADTEAPAFEFVCRHSVKVVGLTQIGDVIVENNDDWAETSGEDTAP